MFTEQFNVRFYETDALAHVSNTVLVGWFESGREPIFKLFTPTLDVQNWPLILASYKVDFLQQIYYGTHVEVRTFVSRIGGSSFDVYQELWQSGNNCATGTTTLVHYDFQGNQASSIPDGIREALKKHFLQD